MALENMKKIELLTFKGCQSTVDFMSQLENLRDDMDIDIQMIIVPSPDYAEKMDLAGSPTIIIDGVEYQKERRGPTGFY